MQELVTIMQLCWQQDPKLRPSMGKVIDMLEKYSREELQSEELSLLPPIEVGSESRPWYTFPRTRSLVKHLAGGRYFSIDSTSSTN